MDRQAIEKLAGGIKANLLRNEPGADAGVIDRACESAATQYAGRTTPDGRALVIHCLETALILSSLNLDAATLGAAILMDGDPGSVADPSVAGLVQLLRKMRALQFSNEKREQAGQLRELMVALSSDVRLLLIKLASRLDLMRHINTAPAEGRENFAQETLDIISPLAHRLGLSQLKSELEDLCFEVLYPEEFQRLKRLAGDSALKREEAVSRIIELLKEIFKEHGLKVHITGRTKRLYSTYLKMLRQNKGFHELYDLAAVRIITNTVPECYQALAVLHVLWTPVNEEFDNYIAVPKPNGYQSIHTVVIAPNGQPVEIQIRTWEMHARAEYGVAAHFSYKAAVDADHRASETVGALGWVKQIADSGKKAAPDDKLLDSIVIDAQEDRVFALTPKGRVVPLPVGSTPIDFAYRIHSDIGNQCRGAKINGRIAPIDQKLRNGDVVDIMIQKGGAPSRDWLRFIASPLARNKIRAWFKKADREENVLHGRSMIQREIARVGLKRKDLLELIPVEDILRAFNFKTEEDLFAAVGCGDVAIESVIERYRRGYRELIAKEESSAPPARTRSQRTRKRRQDVIVEGFSDVMVTFPKCCFPLPGDPIIGFVTHTRGLAIHRKSCANIQQFLETGERIINVSWEESTQETYFSEIETHTIDRVGVLQEILAVISEAKINIAEVKSKVLKNGSAITTIRLEVTGTADLDRILPKITRIDDVIYIRRKA